MKNRNFKNKVFTNCDRMLNFVNFKIGGICVHPCIQVDVMLRILLNLLMVKLKDICFSGDVNRTARTVELLNLSLRCNLKCPQSYNTQHLYETVSACLILRNVWDQLHL